MNEGSWVTQLLAWLERVLPTVLGAFGLGYKVGSDGKKEMQAQRDQAELANELFKNEIQNEKDFSSKSSDDVLDEHFGPGVGPKKPTPEDKG